MQRALDRLALNVEDAGFQEYVDPGLHCIPPSMTFGISPMMPSRLATSV
jgi:hypothetical protein